MHGQAVLGDPSLSHTLPCSSAHHSRPVSSPQKYITQISQHATIYNSGIILINRNSAIANQSIAAPSPIPLWRDLASPQQLRHYKFYSLDGSHQKTSFLTLVLSNMNSPVTNKANIHFLSYTFPPINLIVKRPHLIKQHPSVRHVRRNCRDPTHR